jgi:hypothetical protein
MSVKKSWLSPPWRKNGKSEGKLTISVDETATDVYDPAITTPAAIVQAQKSTFCSDCGRDKNINDLKTCFNYQRSC